MSIENNFPNSLSFAPFFFVQKRFFSESIIPEHYTYLGTLRNYAYLQDFSIRSIAIIIYTSTND